MIDQTVLGNTGSALSGRFNLSGRRALVTGGSMSIGAAIAIGLAEAGADVAIQTARKIDASIGLDSAADDVADTIDALGRRAAIIDADLSVAGSGRLIVDEATAALGGIDVLVICASVQQRSRFEDVSSVDVQRQIDINFAGSICILQQALPPMQDRGWGRVLSIGSINQIRPEAELAVYAALKSAQHNLISNLAKTYARSGVTLNTLSPGLVATERNRWRREVESDWQRIEGAANPMGRAGNPQEMVGAALLLCSDAGSFITGIDLQASGGAQL